MWRMTKRCIHSAFTQWRGISSALPDLVVELAGGAEAQVSIGEVGAAGQVAEEPASLGGDAAAPHAHVQGPRRRRRRRRVLLAVAPGYHRSTTGEGQWTIARLVIGCIKRNTRGTNVYCVVDDVASIIYLTV